MLICLGSGEQIYSDWSESLVALLAQALLGDGLDALLTVLDERQADTLRLREADGDLVGPAHDERVKETRRERVAVAVLDVDDVEGARVALNVNGLAHTARVGSARHHDGRSRLELDEVHNLVLDQVELDRVTPGDERVREPDRAAVVGRQDRDAVHGRADGPHLQQLELGRLRVHLLEHEASLHVVQHTESVLRLRDGQHVHEANRVLRVGAHLVVDLHQALLRDHHRLLARERVLQTVPQDEEQGQGLSALGVRAPGPRGVQTSQLGDHPVLRGSQPLHVLLRTTTHFRVLYEGAEGCNEVQIL
eukprot:Rhum_TRINITY_DN11613_c0_g1::Rhum_TRINITY_DN11613_c0_g1_i1::g.46227::m.46227